MQLQIQLKSKKESPQLRPEVIAKIAQIYMTKKELCQSTKFSTCSGRANSISFFHTNTFFAYTVR